MEDRGYFLEVSPERGQLTRARWRWLGSVCVLHIADDLVLCFGPDWMFAFVMALFIGCMSGLYASVIVPSVPETLQPGTILLPSSLILTFLWLALGDPGLPKELVSSNRSSQQRDRETECRICDVQQRNNRQHCEVCNVCVDGYDHHCPFSSKCIGAGNKLAFHLFVTCLYMTLLGIVLWAVFLSETMKPEE